jgi:acetolactate synthase I/II/III large subunit
MRLTGGQALARQLVLEGITDVFGIPGVQLDWAVDGLRQLGNQIRYVVPRHEQTASYMADGYARSTGRIGACMVVPGPGLLNAMAGLATAYACNARVLAIVGNIHSAAIGKGWGLLHEVRNQSEILGAVTKWHAQARAAKDIPGLIREAAWQLRSGRPQPVGVEIAFDLLSATDDVDLVQRNPAEDGRVRPDPALIEKAAALLSAAELPVIYVGGGALAARASAPLAALAEKLNAPVVLSENGRGALSDRHPLALTALAGRGVFAQADVALIVGSRFADTSLGLPSWDGGGGNLKYIWLNLDAQAWTPPRRADVGIEADAGLGLEALAAALPRGSRVRDLDLDRARAWAEGELRDVADLMGWIRALRSAIPDDGIFVNELTQVGYLTRSAYPVYAPGTYITPGYQGTLGYGFPTALGAAYGNPGRAVVCITGDGGFGWGLAELATVGKYGLKPTVVVFNDGHFGNVKRLQEDQFGGALGADLHNPHFDRLAAAFDIAYARADTPDELEKVLKRSLGTAPLLIEARVGALSSPWPYMRLRGGKPNQQLPDIRRSH